MANLDNHSKDHRHDRAKCSPPEGELVGAFLFVIIAVFMALTSCNVTRTVTTSAQTIQRGDTTTIIQTRTIEQYDGAVDATKFLKK